LFKGAVGDFSKQEHDFNPGIKRTGLFWTVRMPADLLDSNAPVGRAHMRGRRMAVPDFHDFFNSISPDAKGQPGHVSFDVFWRGDGDEQRIRDRGFDFAGRFIPGRAHIDFRVREDHSDVVYTSVRDGQKTVSGGVGRERNGVFFP
jgi:hypothetical protein